MAGLLSSLAGEYLICSTDELGYERCEYLLTPQAGNREDVFIIRYKVCKPEHDVDAEAENGMALVNRRKYAEYFENVRCSKTVCKISIALLGKNVGMRYAIQKLKEIL